MTSDLFRIITVALCFAWILLFSVLLIEDRLSKRSSTANMVLCVFMIFAMASTALATIKTLVITTAAEIQSTKATP